MSEITELLAQARAGEPRQLTAVFEKLYPELRRLAAARLRGNQAEFTPTVLVHEFYLRAIADARVTLADRRHFFAAAAQAMRWIVVDHARRQQADKRGGQRVAVTLTERQLVTEGLSTDMLALHESLDALDQISPRQRQVVEMRFFAGLEFAQIGELLECSERTAKREWARARAFLHAQLADD